MNIYLIMNKDNIIVMGSKFGATLPKEELQKFIPLMQQQILEKNINQIIKTVVSMLQFWKRRIFKKSHSL